MIPGLTPGKAEVKNKKLAKTPERTDIFRRWDFSLYSFNARHTFRYLCLCVCVQEKEAGKDHAQIRHSRSAYVNACALNRKKDSPVR